MSWPSISRQHPFHALQTDLCNTVFFVVGPVNQFSLLVHAQLHEQDLFFFIVLVEPFVEDCFASHGGGP